MPVMVCRDDALAALRGAVVPPPALVLVEGEAGIGKTRLVRECLGLDGWPQRTVLMVECQPVAEPVPLGPVVDGVRRLRQEIGGVGLSPLGGALRSLFPEWVDDLPPPPEPLEDSAARRHRVRRALGELVERLGVELLVVEDAHWADSASLEWLLTCGASRGGDRSVVVTYRPEEVAAGSLLRRLAGGMSSRMVSVPIGLQPLDEAGIQQLTRSMFSRCSVSSEFAGFLLERTGGLPLAVEESLRLLHERGDIALQGGEWARRALAQLRVPPTVRASVLERVERLEAGTRRVLEAAAVLGEPEEDGLLVRVAGLGQQAGGRALAAACKAGLLGGVGVGRTGFRHQLAAEAVEESISVTERRRLHQRAGELLREAGEPSVARLCRHFKEAGDVESWARYAEAAADQALDSGDDQAVVALLHELLTTTTQPPVRRARLAGKLGEAAAVGSALLGEQTEKLVEILRGVVADPETPAGQRGEIRLLLGRLLLWSPGHRLAAYEEIEAAVPDLVDQPVLACHSMILLGMPLAPDWPAERHLQWVKRAAKQLPLVKSRARWLGLVSDHTRALLALGEEAGWYACDRIPRSASSLAERRAVADGLMKVGILAIDWGHYTVARSWLDEAVEVIEATGYRRLDSIARVAGAYLDWCTGRWAGLAETAARLAEAEDTQPFTVRLHARQVQGLVEMASGARRSAEQGLRQVLDGYAQYGLVGPEAATAAAALGRLRLCAGAVEEALQVTELVMTMIIRKGVWLWAADLAPVHLDALVAVGEQNRALELAELFAGWLAGRDAPAPAAASVLCKAIVAEAGGDPARAAGLFARAGQTWARLPNPYRELLALERQGTCLLAAGKPDQAVAVLTEVRTRLRELGARWDSDRVAHLLRQRGVEVPRQGRRGPRGYGNRLSPRELEVVALVARGMTNREAGRVLFLSPRTVGHHLSKAMHKLGVSARTTAAIAAAEAGLISPIPDQPVAAAGADAAGAG